MEEEKHKTVKKFNIVFICIIVVLVGVIGLVCGLTIRNMTHDLYTERAANAESMIEKTGMYMEAVIDKYWTNVEQIASLTADPDYREFSDALALIRNFEKSMDNSEEMLLIETSGHYYTSAGERRMFPSMQILQTDPGSHRVYITDAMSNVDSILLIYTLPTVTELNDGGNTINIKHICLVRAMKSLDDALVAADYGSDSMIFIAESNGALVYHSLKDTPFSNITNIHVQLGTWSYNYGTSAAGVLSDIAERKTGCAHMTYRDKDYFITYTPMNINDWTAVFILPESVVSKNSSEFMRSTIIGISIIAGVVLVAFVVISVVQTLEYRKRQRAVQAQLRLAAQAERDANEAKTRFLSSMSHDIRTPMNAIIGMTNIAGKKIDDKEAVKDCLSKITLAGNHLLTLINDILDISKVESGRMVLSPVDFSLADLATNLVSIVQPQINAKKQEFEIRVHNIKYEYLHADELRLSQIFINLLTNAVKYTPEGGRITLDLHQEATEDEHTVRLIYKVKDTGIGMSAEYMEKMYETFTRATDSRVNKIQGTGLGLAICRQMTKLMGGEIECESEINKGTTFTVTIDLPVAKDQEEHALPPLNVLLVDDDEIFLETASDTLESLGMTVDKASSGQKAVEMAAARHREGNDYPVIIVDIRMPGMDGMQTTRAIRGELGAGVPIILVSAYDRADVEDEVTDAGANGFISKPFFRSAVFYELTRHLGLDAEKEEEDAIEAESEFNGMHILVAEDNDLNWEIIEEILNEHGISAVRAENGLEAVERMNAATEGEYDLVLMDVQMPVMDGRAATRELRKSDSDYVRSIPVIAMTADAFAEDVAACMEAGMNGHVPKPVDIKKLLNELRKINKNRNS